MCATCPVGVRPELCSPPIYLSAACELDSSRFIDLNLDLWPKTKAWLHHMIDENPIMLELHRPMRKYAADFVNSQKAEGISVTPKV